MMTMIRNVKYANPNVKLLVVNEREESIIVEGVTVSRKQI